MIERSEDMKRTGSSGCLESRFRNEFLGGGKGRKFFRWSRMEVFMLVDGRLSRGLLGVNKDLSLQRLSRCTVRVVFVKKKL